MINRKELREIFNAVVKRLNEDPEIAGRPCKKKDFCADDPCACPGADFCADDPCAWICVPSDF